MQVPTTEQCLNKHLVLSNSSLKVTSNFRIDILRIDDRMKLVYRK